LEQAIDDKLDEQALFGADYRAKYPDGRYASTGIPDKKDYCLQFGFSLRSVQRWCERLLDPEKKEKEREIRKAKPILILVPPRLYGGVYYLHVNELIIQRHIRNKYYLCCKPIPLSHSYRDLT